MSDKQLPSLGIILDTILPVSAKWSNRRTNCANPFLEKRLLLLNGGCNEPRTRP
jgi:hypothetical protein